MVCTFCYYSDSYFYLLFGEVFLDRRVAFEALQTELNFLSLFSITDVNCIQFIFTLCSIVQLNSINFPPDRLLLLANTPPAHQTTWWSRVSRSRQSWSRHQNRSDWRRPGDEVRRGRRRETRSYMELLSWDASSIGPESDLDLLLGAFWRSSGTPKDPLLHQPQGVCGGLHSGRISWWRISWVASPITQKADWRRGFPLVSMATSGFRKSPCRLLITPQIKIIILVNTVIIMFYSIFSEHNKQYRS